MEANNKQQYINKDGVQDCYIETLRVKTKDQALRKKDYIPRKNPSGLFLTAFA